MSLYERITALCRDSGISVSMLERSTDLHNIYRWDTATPSVDKVSRVAEYFGVSIDSLIGLEEQPRNEHEAAVLARYNSLSAENRALIDELMEKLKSQK